MGNGTRLTFDIFARDHASDTFDKFGKTVKGSGTEVEQTGKKMGGAKKHVAGFVGAFAGFAVISKATDFLKDANAEARESQKVGARTTNVIKTTGGAAKVTAKQVGDLSTAISNKTAVDDEAVQAGANLLLTFKNVRNEAGKQNRIFDRATAAAVDLSASGFGSVAGASKMLGKSLNDPIKGISALGRAGVTFSAQQKAQIKALVEGGDAQAAMAMGLIDSTATYNNLLKANGNDADKVAKILKSDLTPAQQKAFDMYAEGGHTLEAQKRIMKEVESQVKGSASAQATSTEKLTTSWNNFKEMIGTKMLPVIDTAALKLTKVTNWAQKNPGTVRTIAIAFGVLAVAFIALTSPITLVIAALAAMAVGLGYLYTKNKTFAKFVDFAWNKLIKPALGAMWFYYSKVLFPAILFFWSGVVKPVFTKVGSFAIDMWQNKIKPAFGHFREGLRLLRGAFRTTKNNIASVWGTITGAITKPLDLAKTALNKFFAGIDKIASFFGKSFKFRFDVGNPGGASDATMKRPRGGIGAGHVAAAAGAIATGGKGGGGGKAWPANTKAMSANYPGHSGVDIAAANGSPIKAAASGKIQYVGTGRGYGQAIFQSLPGGLSAVYGHTSKTYVRGGQSVRAGQHIGDVGWTGNVRPKGPAGAHLHYEVNGAGPFGSAANRAATLAWLGGAPMTKGKGKSAGMPGIPGLKMSGWLAPLGGSLVGMAKSWVKGAVFDTGGMLPSGQAALNLSGRPERVLNPRETADLSSASIGYEVARQVDRIVKKTVRDALDGSTLQDDRGRTFRLKAGAI